MTSLKTCWGFDLEADLVITETGNGDPRGCGRIRRTAELRGGRDGRRGHRDHDACRERVFRCRGPGGQSAGVERNQFGGHHRPAAKRLFLSTVQAPTPPTRLRSISPATFNETVTGVDTADFVVDAGGVTGATVSGVAGSGTTYTVTVDTGSGDGTLSIDLTDDDSILDATGNPLGGAGAGNGDYTVSEAYTVDKTAPTVASMSPVPGSTVAAASVDIDVTFDETVTVAASTAMTLSGTAAGAASVGTPLDQGGSTWRFPISGLANGTLSISLGAADDLVEDPAGNDLSPCPTTWNYSVLLAERPDRSFRVGHDFVSASRRRPLRGDHNGEGLIRSDSWHLHRPG